MLRLKKSCLGLLLLVGLVGALPAQPPSDLPTIQGFEPGRYLGTWYEIAKFPNRFQKQCVANTKAVYTALPAGTLQVDNSCELANGQRAQAIGEARFTDMARGKLQVRFAPAWLGWLPLVWGRYWIIDLDQNYSSVLVGEPDREYLWILSRTPAMDSQRYQALIERAALLGFDTSRLEKSVQRQ
jgi:apolipoprotein D and lipocalin family protein